MCGYWRRTGSKAMRSLSGRSELLRVAETVIRGHGRLLERAPHAFPTLARAAWLAERGLSVAVIVGAPEDPATAELVAAARRHLGPEDAVLAAAPGAAWPEAVDPAWIQGRAAVDGRATAYVCRGVTCSLPVTDPEELDACLDLETRASTDAGTKTA